MIIFYLVDRNGYGYILSKKIQIVYYATRAYSITLRTSGERADRPSV